MIFLRYVSTAFEKRYQELVSEGEGFEDDRDAYAEKNDLRSLRGSKIITKVTKEGFSFEFSE